MSENVCEGKTIDYDKISKKVLISKIFEIKAECRPSFLSELMETIQNCPPYDFEQLKEQIRTEVIAEISREMRMLYGNEYEKKIRADAIREYKSKLRTDVSARAQNCYKGMFNEREQEIFNFATKTFLDALDYFAEKLKEQK